ncbi:alpha-amylase [Raoultella ornithinolytica]|nr:alpha-amylase [Raoultella ornithinolytica]
MKFHEASRQGRDYDMSQIFSGTLVESDPFHAVTLVTNHDTQPLQALEAPVEPWFKPLAYALILLRENGVPSVFYADLFGASYEDTGGDGQTYAIEMPVIEQLHELIDARQRFAHGVQTLWFDHPNCIAFSRSGTDEIRDASLYCLTAMRERSSCRWAPTMAISAGKIFWAIARRW